ncbi:hypothetical protein BOTBODRAFT_150711 [Botryobasidium botryosum FD-172 SS1]|uniref:Lysine-specific metallo-endopeptidase domain-containing protein n=1 Tax=Botryobasidium botryosum (strain FD-172 SS1) TaxID=930990 RepID=A0A067N463_BOTB1|nr:hypothetical protein BOTBODRAFT_150711 [Botryobasidium botryosum FD-172 SS1]
MPGHFLASGFDLGPGNIDGIANLKVTTTLRNTGDQNLTLLHDPLSILTPEWATDTFLVVKADGTTRPKFSGIMAKWSPALAAEANHATILAPGQAVEHTHDLSTRYDFTAAGAGIYNFRARDTFTHIDASGNFVSIKATVSSPASATISGNLAAVQAAPRPVRFAKRANYVSCSSDQQSSIGSTIIQAASYAQGASAYLTKNTASTDRYTTWFGAYDTERHSTVQSHFQSIAGNDFTTFTYDCSCTATYLFAYVQKDNFGYITFCGAFWRAPLTGTDSKAGTVVHEASHFNNNGGTDDVTYTQPSCKDLANQSPALAITNADSHEYFAENNPAQA